MNLRSFLAHPLRAAGTAATLLLVLAVTPWTAAAADGSAAPKTLLVVGDSISAEYGLERDTGWVRLLDARMRSAHYDYAIVNASISGETTSGGRSRIDELLARVKPAVVVVELGGNDALRGLPLDVAQRNLGEMVAHAQAANARVLLVGMQLPPNYGKAYTDRFVAIYTDTAARYQTALVPFFFKGFETRDDLFQPDRIHPTGAAQTMLLDNVWPALQPLLARGR